MLGLTLREYKSLMKRNVLIRLIDFIRYTGTGKILAILFALDCVTILIGGIYGILITFGIWLFIAFNLTGLIKGSEIASGLTANPGTAKRGIMEDRSFKEWE